VFRLRVLGGFALEGPAGEVVPLAQRRAEAFLAILAVCGELGCTRERLMALLWPDGDDRHSRHVVRNVLHAIRQSLGKDAVVSRADGLYLAPSVVGSDVHDFTRSITTGAPRDGVSQYSGPLLDGFHVDGAPDFERWLDAERTRLGRQYEEALQRLATQAESSGAWDEAVLWWRRLVEHDPSNSRLVLRCAQATYATGDRVNALKALDAHVRWMRQNIDLDPDPEVLVEIERMRRRAEPDHEPDRQALAGSAPAQSGESLTPLDRPIVGEPPTANEPTRPAPAGPTVAPLSLRWPRWSKWAVLVVIAGAVVALPLVFRKRAASGPPFPRTAVAVLPFQNLSTDSAHAFFARGLHDEVLSRLAKVPTLKVVDPSSVLGYQDSTKPLRRIGQELGVGSVVEATVQVVGARLRVIVQLVDPATQTHLWGQRYDRTVDDALAVEGDIARQVVAALVAHYGFVTIDVPGATNTEVTGINNVGQVVGFYSTPTDWDRGFSYDGNTYTTLNYPGTVVNRDRYWGGTAAQSLNDSGVIVGGHGRTYLGVPYGFTYSGGGFRAMPSQPCALASEARGVNNGGQIVGISELSRSSCFPHPTSMANPSVGYLYSGGTFTALAPPGSMGSSAHGVNNHGIVVGSYADAAGTRHGFQYVAGHYTTIDVPGSTSTSAMGVNNVRQIVGSYTLPDGTQHGFLLSEGTFTTIDVPGATATAAAGINNAGWIVGNYTDSTGTHHGFEKTR
jgi:TolB-like protein/DNA-binding SARP family transcriptional activator